MRHESGSPKISDSGAPCLGADQKTRGLWEREWLLTIFIGKKKGAGEGI